MDLNTPRKFSLYATPPHPCGYLPGRQAVTVFVDPHQPKTRQLYSHLSRQGFRRSGDHLYRPYCQGCRACVPVRVPVSAFQPRRSQRRVWEHNQDLRVREVRAGFVEEHFQLYRRYLAQRHPGSGMDNPSPATYMQFLAAAWADTWFYEFRDHDALLAVAVVDHLEDGLSAVYTFFDPTQTKRGLGVQAVLWEVAEARRLGLDYVYLGYWVEDCRKMSYKTTYQPLEYYYQADWRTQPPLTDVSSP